MNQADLPSDSDESDVDYAPSDAENALSEVESDGDVEEDPTLSGSDGETSGRKRKAKQKLVKKKAKTGGRGKAESEDEKEVDEEQKLLTDEEEKKKTDSLWSDFLSDTSSSKAKPTTDDSKRPEKVTTKKEPVIVKEKPQKVVVTKVFEFAGEEVRVTKEVASDSAEARLSGVKPGTTTAGRGKPTGGLKGLSAVLGQLGKKEKIGTLEKSKLDWDKFKRVEGIEDEVQTHNRGKDGYLERQDFLQRADVRQFEIEKDMRTTRRSNR